MSESKYSRHHPEQRRGERAHNSCRNAPVQPAKAKTALQQSNQCLMLLSQVARRISNLHHVEPALNEVAWLVYETMGYDFLSIGLVEGDEIVIHEIAGHGPEALVGTHLRIGQGIAGWAVTHQQALRVPDVLKDQRYTPHDPAIPGIRSQLVLPIQVGDCVLGMLNVESVQPAAFDQMDEILMQAVADQLAMALKNILMFQKAQVQRDEARAVAKILYEQTESIVGMNRLASAMLTSMAPDDVAENFIMGLCKEMGVQKAALWLVEADELRLAAKIGVKPIPVSRKGPGCTLNEAGDNPCAALLRVWCTGRRESSQTFKSEGYSDAYFDNWIMFPLKSQNVVLGILVTEQGVLEEDVLAMLSNQAALALAAAHSHQQVRRQATMLAQTNAELARSNADLAQFAHIASHDLQEPLRMVKSFLQLLVHQSGDQLDTTAYEYITYAIDGAKRMQDLINALLRYAQVGTRGGDFTPTNCEVVIEHTLTDLRITIEESGATVTHDPLPTVIADSIQLGQVFQNLISNAIKFNAIPDQAPPRVHISAQKCLDSESQIAQWRFSVQDNGIGIDPENFDRLFVIFQRLHTRQDYPGTGIGLAVCKRIVERHGGRIWVASQPGEGTTFYFTIPERPLRA